MVMNPSAAELLSRHSHTRAGTRRVSLRFQERIAHLHLRHYRNRSPSVLRQLPVCCKCAHLRSNPILGQIGPDSCATRHGVESPGNSDLTEFPATIMPSMCSRSQSAIATQAHGEAKV